MSKQKKAGPKPKAKAAPKKVGRPSTFTQSTADALLAHLRGGMLLVKATKLPGMPCTNTVESWLKRDPDFARAYAQARATGCDAMAQEALDIVDAVPPTATGTNGREFTDTGHVQWQRLRADTRMRLLACIDPARYGNKIAVDGEVKHNHNFATAIAAVMSQEQGTGEVSPPAQTH